MAGTTSWLDQLKNLLEGDLVLNFGPPLITFLQNIAAANGDKVKDMAALVQLQGDIMGHAPFAIGGLETQLAQIIAARIQGLMTNVPSVAQSIAGLSGQPATPPAAPMPPTPAS